MSKYHFDPEKVADTWLNSESDFDDIISAMKEFGRQVRDSTLEWAADNAEHMDRPYPFNNIIDTERILAGKTSKDLEI